MRRGYVILAALCASVFVVGTSEYLIAGLLPQVGGDLGVSVGTAGQAVTAYALGVVIGGPLVTIATARLPRKGVALGLMLLFAAGSALSAWAPVFSVLLAGRVVSSLSHAAFLALALVTAARVVSAERVVARSRSWRRGSPSPPCSACRWARCSVNVQGGGHRLWC